MSARDTAWAVDGANRVGYCLTSALAAHGSCSNPRRGRNSFPIYRQLLRDCGAIARERRFDDTIHVLLKEVAVGHEPQSRRTHLADVIGLILVTLCERSAWVASRRARCLIRREPER